jgi:hypothetical protein
MRITSMSGQFASADASNKISLSAVFFTIQLESGQVRYVPTTQAPLPLLMPALSGYTIPFSWTPYSLQECLYDTEDTPAGGFQIFLTVGLQNTDAVSTHGITIFGNVFYEYAKSGVVTYGGH